jgi:CP family cyanate transporter-like MFS transporter
VLAGVVSVVAMVGMLATPLALQPVWVALLGIGPGCVFVLAIALPPLLATREEVARLTGATLSLSYTIAFLGPFLGGALWDVFGVPQLAFAPVAVAGVAMIVLAASLPSRLSFLAARVASSSFARDASYAATPSDTGTLVD